MVETFKIKKNDTLPALAVTMLYANGSAVDLTGGSVFFNMGTRAYAPFYSGLATVTSSTAGQVEYRWNGSPDTQTPGVYFGEFEFQIGGSKLTLPTDHSLKIEIFEDYN